MPCPPPQSALSKDCSRSRLADSTKIDLSTSTSPRFSAAQPVDVLRRECAASRADQDRVHRFRVAFREEQVLFFREVLIFRDPDDQRVAAGRGYVPRRVAGLGNFFDAEIPLLLLGLLPE